MQQQYIRQFRYSAQDIIDAIDRVNPEQEYYFPHDITGDGRPETFCNWFVADVLYILGIPIPRYSHASLAGSYPIPHPLYGYSPPEKPWSANQLYAFFEKGGYNNWRTIDDLSSIVKFVNAGHVIIACEKGESGSPGHIAIVVPGQEDSGIHVAQAGNKCKKDIPVEEGFGDLAPKYYLYSSIRSSKIPNRLW
jgi:hypothetical protein